MGHRGFIPPSHAPTPSTTLTNLKTQRRTWPKRPFYLTTLPHNATHHTQPYCKATAHRTNLPSKRDRLLQLHHPSPPPTNPYRLTTTTGLSSLLDYFSQCNALSLCCFLSLAHAATTPRPTLSLPPSSPRTHSPHASFIHTPRAFRAPPFSHHNNQLLFMLAHQRQTPPILLLHVHTQQETPTHPRHPPSIPTTGANSALALGRRATRAQRRRHNDDRTHPPRHGRRQEVHGSARQSSSRMH